MRSLSYLKQLQINCRGYYFSNFDIWIAKIAIKSEQDEIIRSNTVHEKPVVKTIRLNHYHRKTNFCNKRIGCKHKRRSQY